MSTALLVIDIQNDYFPKGKMELVGPELAASKAAALISTFRDRGLPIFHVQHLATRPTATFFLPGSAGAEIHESVKPLYGETVVTKHHPSAFRETTLLNDLRAASVKDLVVAGMMTHMCVDTTVRAAVDLGFSCSLAHDACATRALTFGGSTVGADAVQISYLAAISGTFAQVLPASELCARHATA